jgi:phenylacetic acid degradation operon negative regulatory protein
MPLIRSKLHHASMEQESSLDDPRADNGPNVSARSMLFTVLGELVYRGSEPVWTSALLYVLMAAGFSEHAARQAIARGAAAGWIRGERVGRETRWRLTPTTRRMFDEGAERVFAFSAQRPPWDGRWLIILVSIPNPQRTLRKRLYGMLRWAGLGNPAPGLWLTPHTERVGEVERVIRELGLEHSTMSVIGEPGVIGMPEEEIVRRAWDLEDVAANYRTLMARFAAVDPLPGDPVLLAHLELTDALRRFPFIDPQLPEMLAPDWVGREATRTLTELRARWSSAAEARWREILACRNSRYRE